MRVPRRRARAWPLGASRPGGAGASASGTLRRSRAAGQRAGRPARPREPGGGAPASVIAPSPARRTTAAGRASVRTPFVRHALRAFRTRASTSSARVAPGVAPCYLTVTGIARPAGGCRRAANPRAVRPLRRPPAGPVNAPLRVPGPKPASGHVPARARSVAGVALAELRLAGGGSCFGLGGARIARRADPGRRRTGAVPRIVGRARPDSECQRCAGPAANPDFGRASWLVRSSAGQPAPRPATR